MFEDTLDTSDQEVVRVPNFVKGKLVLPESPTVKKLQSLAHTSADRWTEEPASFDLGEVVVIRRPILDRTTLTPAGRDQFLVFPAVDPRQLIETDVGELARGLYALPFDEVLAYAKGLRDLLQPDSTLVAQVEEYAKATSWVDHRLLRQFFVQLPALFDPDGLGELVDRELGTCDGPGRRYLDGWCGVQATPHRGATARIGDRIHSRVAGPGLAPRLRAVPTRQLHITAGNALIVPVVSCVRALASKGAATIKSPAAATAVTALLAGAMTQLDPTHPITRHTSLVYWRGGDRRVEDVLLAPGAFDRVVVWGGADAVSGVAARSAETKHVLFRPRVGISIIGSEAFASSEEAKAVAARATVDTMIANQAACTSSLVHYVEGSQQQVLEYCRQVQRMLAKWDQALPHAAPRHALARLRQLKRGDLAGATWFENGDWPRITSAVACMPSAFDLASHPGSRFVVVRPVGSLADALPFIHPGISSVGVYPESRREALQDDLAARGVSTILPLGETECSYAGMPHDGMKVLSELMSWVSS